MILNEWRKIRPQTGYGRSIETVSSRWWRSASLVSLVVPLLRRPLVKYVGDIVLYVTADERSEHFRARQEILDAATAHLRHLLADAGYRAVYVAGHSLGSVIAYDAINALIAEVRANVAAAAHLTTRAQLDRLQGLLTFGSPLDKVYYFFRIEVGEEEAIRAQLLSSLYGFRRAPSGRDYGNLKLAPYSIPEPAGFTWLNVYSRTDPVSAWPDFYEVDARHRWPYWDPFAAHVRYWNDPGFSTRVVAWMCGHPGAPPGRSVEASTRRTSSSRGAGACARRQARERRPACRLEHCDPAGARVARDGRVIRMADRSPRPGRPPRLAPPPPGGVRAPAPN